MVNEHEVRLFESVQVRSHWSDLRRKLEKESGQPYEKIVRIENACRQQPRLD